MTCVIHSRDYTFFVMCVVAFFFLSLFFLLSLSPFITFFDLHDQSLFFVGFHPPQAQHLPHNTRIEPKQDW
jgi:hypothetical protein